MACSCETSEGIAVLCQQDKFHNNHETTKCNEQSWLKEAFLDVVYTTRLCEIVWTGFSKVT